MNECVQCGYCCTVRPCAFGKWEDDKCKYLSNDNMCTVFELIKNMPGADISPAFGAGCCSPLFNERRREKLHAMDNNGPGQ